MLSLVNFPLLEYVLTLSHTVTEARLRTLRILNLPMCEKFRRNSDCLLFFLRLHWVCAFPTGSLKARGARVTGSSELPEVGAGKPTQIIWKKKHSELQSSLSSPLHDHFLIFLTYYILVAQHISNIANPM